MIPLAAPYGWNNGGAVMTLVLPLGFFIVVMIALYFVFTRPHTVPGRRPIAPARPVAPGPQTARDMSAAVGFGTASSGGGTPPLADRATPPAVGAAGKDAGLDANLPEDASDEAAFGAGESDKSGPTDSSEDPE